jgi:transmembrane sensor
MESAEDRASREATRWFVELQERPADRQFLRQFDAWLKSSPLNAAAWEETQQVSRLASTMPVAYGNVWQATRARRPVERPPAWLGMRGSIPRIALATAVTACLAVVVAPPLILRAKADYTTTTAQSRSVTLQDGSEIELAPDSAIAVAYTSAERRITLLSGEAFFKVVTDPARAFHVIARAVDTRVVGTRFDVSMESDGVTVAVEHGTVLVSAADASSLGQSELRAGQAIRVSPAGRHTPVPAATDAIATWRSGRLIAHSLSLREAVERLRRYWTGTIVLVGTELGDLRVTGAYDLTDPEDALRAMARTHNARVRRITPWILLVSDL